MPAKQSFSTRLLRPAATFLSPLNEYLSLKVVFRPFLWDGKTIDTELWLDLHNVLPSPYLRDLINLQLTLSDEENSFAEGGAPEPERLLDGSLHPI
ncbi:hypothetical protein [Kingella denitrificans]|jgi:hypothetical protein|uniref:hypothetical protein n=1 Tax=Kingella denitrificans TaxID=502 RepID=UPI000B99309F|nr:hypothetical protein [Kingella denitrificans]